MNKKILLLGIIILVLCSFTVNASDPTTTFDPKRPEKFGYNNLKADYNSVPPGKLKIEKIPKNRLNELDSKHILPHLSKFNDLSLLNPTELSKVIQKKYGVSVKVGKGTTLRGGILTSKTGKTENVNNYPKGSQFIVNENDGTIKVILPKTTDGKPYEIKSMAVGVTAFGNFRLPDGSVINGEIKKLSETAFVIKRGVNFESQSEKFKINNINDDVYLFLNTPDFNPENYRDKNYFFYSSKKVDMHTKKRGSFGIEFMAGNRFFNMFRTEIGKDGNSITVPDDKDLLRIKIKDGDRLIFESDPSGIPIAKHIGSENGNTEIENGRLTFKLDKNNFLVNVKTFSDKETRDKIVRGKFQSVPFDLSSESLKFTDSDEYKKLVSELRKAEILGDVEEVKRISQELKKLKTEKSNLKYLLRIGSANQFVIVDEKTGEAETIFNRFNFPLTRGRNQIQTLSQLKAKWNQRGIDLYKAKSRYDRFLERFVKAEFKIDPFTVQIVDSWLEQNPNTKLDYIAFAETSKFAAGDVDRPSEEEGILVGIISDPYHQELLKSRVDREFFTDIMASFNHEDDHIQDRIPYEIEKRKLPTIPKEERKKFKRYSEIVTEITQEKYKLIKSDPEYRETTKKIYDYILSNRDKFPRKYGKDIDYVINTKDISSIKPYLHIETIGLVEVDPTLLSMYLNLKKVVNKYGLPAVYTLNNFGTEEKPIFVEVTATWKEESLEERKRKANSQNIHQRDFYRKITQIEFDAGKIDSVECAEIMGTECKKCVIYKLPCV